MELRGKKTVSQLLGGVEKKTLAKTTKQGIKLPRLKFLTV